MYKACWLDTCTGADLAAGMDGAVQDGVDIVSISLGSDSSKPYEKDPLAMGAFTAMAKGIFVALSAGIEGPYSNFLENFAPWQTIVGAGTLDRDFPAYVSLWNRENILVYSLHDGNPQSTSIVPVVYAGNISDSPKWTITPLPREKVEGKIVLCDGSPQTYKGLAVRNAGGIGVIFRNIFPFGEELEANTDLIPSVCVGEIAGKEILTYVMSSTISTASLSWGATRVNVQHSPKATAFSSRDPHPYTPGLLKPDILAPGLNIITGYTRRVGPTELEEDKCLVDYKILFGTSMLCPHLAGVAALIKAAKPKFTPTMIMSAIMATANNKYRNRDPLETNGFFRV